MNTEVTTQVFKTNLSWWWYLKLNKNLFKLFSPGLLNRDIEIISKSVMLKRDPSCWSSLWCYFLAYEFFTNRPMDGCYFFKDIFIIYSWCKVCLLINWTEILMIYYFCPLYSHAKHWLVMRLLLVHLNLFLIERYVCLHFCRNHIFF